MYWSTRAFYMKQPNKSRVINLQNSTHIQQPFRESYLETLVEGEHFYHA